MSQHQQGRLPQPKNKPQQTNQHNPNPTHKLKMINIDNSPELTLDIRSKNHSNEQN
jgi:hypothetical protein